MSPTLETIDLPHLPSSLAVHAALYKDVQNASYLRQQLLSANTDFEYAFIDASMILSRAHALAAVFRAVNDYQNERLKSRNIHSEIVFSFSPTNNIADSFRKFGISDSTSNLLVVKVSVTPDITHETVAAHLAQNVEGAPLPLDDEALSGISDIGKIKKVYKLGSLPSTSSGQMNGTASEEKRRLELSVLGAIALRGAT
ncbi:kinase binding protein CGI-121-domain-containing protein [Aspergillus karnatakaensis]|uniref:EKC/KEOPS complex subunit CGI121/TPRKB n=1 Tax=Aspergillus karnatakaensis TaxID=1810916 RepID=UPI003CCCD2FD